MDYFANTTPGQDMTMESTTKVSNDVASWKNLSASEREPIVLMGPQKPPKSLPKDGKNRSFPISIFSRKMPNGEIAAKD